MWKMPGGGDSWNQLTGQQLITFWEMLLTWSKRPSIAKLPDRKVYCACFSPTTEKYPQPEKFSAYTLSISLSWKLQRLSPNTTLLRLQWMNLKHTQEFFCFIFSLKEKKKFLTEKETEWKTHIDSSPPETQLSDLSTLQPETQDNFWVCIMPQNRKYSQ